MVQSDADRQAVTTTLWHSVTESNLPHLFAFLGLKAAEMTALPASIVEEAKAIASNVSQQLLVCIS